MPSPALHTAGVSLEHGQPGGMRRTHVARDRVHERVTRGVIERGVGQHDGRLLRGSLQHAPRLGDAALHDGGGRRPTGDQAGFHVGAMRLHPGRVGCQACQQPGETLRRVRALQPGEVADEPLGPAVLVDGLHLPETQVMGLSHPRHDHAHEVQRDRILGREVGPVEGLQVRRPALDHRQLGGAAFRPGVVQPIVPALVAL